MHEIDITSKSGFGTHILCRKWVKPALSVIQLCPLAFGAASRACQDVNGDVFVIRQWSESALVGVIDGLGHGPLARHAAEKARQFIEEHCDLPLGDIFRGTARSCYGTRGVVMALARFDFRQSDIILTFASVGNVEARVFGTPGPMNFMVRRGIVGVNAPSPVVTEHKWKRDWMLVLYSDGIRGAWKWQDFTGLSTDPAPTVARCLLNRLARYEDDATVVVVKGA